MTQISKVLLRIILISVFPLTSIQAQQAIVSAGGNILGDEGTASYSVGQVFYTTNSGSKGSVAAGVNQPYEISVISGTNIGNVNTGYLAYPNPTNNNLILTINEAGMNNKLSYQLFNTNGKILNQQKITNRNTYIRMNKFPPSTYLLKVIQENKELKTFKIIKY